MKKLGILALVLASAVLLRGSVSSSGEPLALSSWEVVQLTGFGASGINVPCPQGKRVLGGGCWAHSSTASGTGSTLEVSAPTDGASWTCIYNAPALELTGYAICAAVDESPSPTPIASQGATPPGADGAT